MSKFESTADIEIPKDPFQRIIGQDEAVAIARLVPVQRRHLLLVGAPGTGKSMIARAISSVLPKPVNEVSILNNPEREERPIVEIRSREKIQEDGAKTVAIGSIVNPSDVPTFVAERLGFRCKRCGSFSAFTEVICAKCGANKDHRTGFVDAANPASISSEGVVRLATTRRNFDGKQETLIYERKPNGQLVVLTASDMRKQEEMNRKVQRKVIVPMDRNLFVQASGGSETELLGDVRHDPYGSHPQLGTPAFMRVVPGAVHEAHEGVLFIDEISTLGNIQRNILTAMQDKSFPIVGRNPTSSGAAVRVDNMPCDFLFVGATNIGDMQHILAPLRSRIKGDGYEVLMNVFLPESTENRSKIIQFIAQEIIKDGKIPHASSKAVDELLLESKRIAKNIDKLNGYSLRLRNLSGIIKLAGDMAVVNKKGLIEKEDVIAAIKNSRPIEEQLKEKYGSWWNVSSADFGHSTPGAGTETA